MMTERHHCLSWSSSGPGVGDFSQAIQIHFGFYIQWTFFQTRTNANAADMAAKISKLCLQWIHLVFFLIVAFVLFSRRTPEEVIAFVLLKRCCDQCDCCNDTDARSERNANWWDGFLLSRQTARHSSRFQLGFMKILRSCAKRAKSSWEAQTVDLQLIMCLKIASRGLW